MLFNDIFCHAITGILHIHLNQYIAIAFVVAAIFLDATIHLRRAFDQTVVANFQFGINPADIFPAHQTDTADCGTDSEMIPVFTRNIRTAEGTREYRHFHLHLILNTICGFGIDVWKRGFIRIGFNPLGTKSIPHNI